MRPRSGDAVLFLPQHRTVGHQQAGLGRISSYAIPGQPASWVNQGHSGGGSSASRCDEIVLRHNDGQSDC
ncbi:Uncharacterised protein [Mycobacteroides abscessus subsp. abscessus]|nr:Uncharacterised protein [Mycobacteroides abscessus subsp. abscessus]